MHYYYVIGDENDLIIEFDDLNNGECDFSISIYDSERYSLDYDSAAFTATFTRV